VILWELKNTKSWSDAWLPKLRDNKRAARAGVTLIISTALPKGVESLDLIDGVYVAHPRCAVPVALTLRQDLLEVASARTQQVGQQSRPRRKGTAPRPDRHGMRRSRCLRRQRSYRQALDREAPARTPPTSRATGEVGVAEPRHVEGRGSAESVDRLFGVRAHSTTLSCSVLII
jgi:Uncharacterized protein conserved in bacteria (DUF2130)